MALVISLLRHTVALVINQVINMSDSVLATHFIQVVTTLFTHQ